MKHFLTRSVCLLVPNSLRGVRNKNTIRSQLAACLVPEHTPLLLLCLLSSRAQHPLSMDEYITYASFLNEFTRK